MIYENAYGMQKFKNSFNQIIVNKKKWKRKQKKERKEKKVKLQFMLFYYQRIITCAWTMNMNLYSLERLFIFFILLIFPYVCTCMVDADRYYAIWCLYHPEAPEGSNHILIFYIITTVLPQKKSKITHVIILNILISHGKIFSSNLWDILWLTNS